MSFLSKILARFWFHFVLLTISFSGVVFAQQQNIAEAWDQQGLGFYLKKVVSNTTICSGQTFSYTIYYSLPAGTQTATISDAVPPSLVVHSVSISTACGTPTVSAPTPGTSGTVSLSYGSGSIPSGGCSGSMTIVVSFPNGVTCNGTSARNRVCINATIKTTQGLQTVEFCTPFVSTTAQASNPWQIQKNLSGGTWQGGNCPWKVVGDTVTYTICVFKNNPAPCGSYGQLNLVGGIVTDVLPSGVQFISATPSTGVSVSGSTITWNVGNLSATQPYNSSCVTIKAYYPATQFPTGSQITNTATLTGQLGSQSSPCSQFTLSSTICWEKVLPAPPTTQVSLFKWGSTNGQPGCAGTYWIRFCNTGTTTLPANSVVIRDTLPATLTPTSASSWPNLTTTTSGNIVTATLNSPLSPGSCTYVTINFTIALSATPNSTISNCSWAQVQGLASIQSCWSFVVNAPAPSPCVWKEICSPQNSYALGQTIRMRLRVQNIGGQPISGATITDNLDPNFQYIGNPMYYVSNAWNTPCNPTVGSGGVMTWSPTPSLSASGQTITVSNVTIPAFCQNVFWNGCGMYGNNTVPYYWIEFDVKIRDTAGLGNIPNFFSMSGGGLSSSVNSNTVLVLTTGQVGFSLGKEVAPDTSSWTSTLNVAPGGSLYYRLQMLISSGSVPLRHATFVDLLPRDASPSDNRILPNPCLNRGSQFDIAYQGLMLANPVATLYKNTASGQASANGIAPIGLFPTSCGTNTSWTAGTPAAGDNNLGVYFTSAVGASPVPTVIFKAQASSNATAGQIACNSFAAGGAVRHYLNSSTVQDVAVSPLESGNVCIGIDSTSKCYSVKITQSPTVIGQTPQGCKYRLVVALNNPGTTTLQGCVTSPQGTVIPSTFTVPVGSSTLTLQFIDTPPQDNFACIYFGVQDPATGACSICDSVCFDLPPCPSDTCCPEEVKIDVKCKEKDPAGNMVYQICASGVIKCKAMLILSTADGTLSPSTFSLSPGNFNICTDFTDTPPTTGVVTIHFVVVGGGAILCRDSVRIQLPECPPQQERCCSLLRPVLQTSISSWHPSGAVVIAGTASAGLPLQRFSATIVRAQRKVVPNIVPAPTATWQRIFGDFTSGVASNPPGPLSVLTPFSRELVWGIQCTQQTSPGSFKLTALFPPAPGWKQRDTLLFTVRYSFTDCECRTCDTLVTYTVVRPGKKIIFPWDMVTITERSPGLVRMTIPPKTFDEEDTSFSVRLTAIELRSPDVRLSGRIVGPREGGEDLLAQSDDGTLVLIPGLNGDEIELELEGVQGVLQARYHYCCLDVDGDGYCEVDYRIGDQRERPRGVVVKDEGQVDNVRTFALAVVNTSKVPLSSPTLVLSPKPQPDGTIPQILAQGGPSQRQFIVIKCSSTGKCHYTINYDDFIEAGMALRPVYLTISGSSQGRMDRVTLEYELRDGDVVVGQGEIELEGAVSGIEDSGDGSAESMHPRINAVIPNPAVDAATVSLWLPRQMSGARLELYDARGGLVSARELTLPAGSVAVEINLSSFTNGIYNLILRTADGISTKQLVIVR